MDTFEENAELCLDSFDLLDFMLTMLLRKSQQPKHR